MKDAEEKEQRLWVKAAYENFTGGVFVYRNDEKKSKEALIKSLSNFILVFLFKARNKPTRIASYLVAVKKPPFAKIT